MSIKNILRKIRRLVRTFLGKINIFLVQMLLTSPRTTIIFSNDSSSKIDGTGAQIQRMIVLCALSRKLGVPFLQKPFSDVSVHPLDPFQDSESKQEFVELMNTLFRVDEPELAPNTTSVSFSTLKPLDLLLITLNSWIRKRAVIIEVCEPYPVTDLFPDINQGINSMFPKWIEFSSELVEKFSRPLICVHYRQGVGGSVLYPGQKIPRELPPEYFLKKLEPFRNDLSSGSSIQLFTDAPATDMIYKPDPSQHHHWTGSPGYENGLMRIRGNKLHEFFTSQKINVDLHVGGSPLEAIAVMAACDFLITSRSSLSYVAGLLNSRGLVVAAENFWHPSPKSWIK